MASADFERICQGMWRRAHNEESLDTLTPELVAGWAHAKGLTDAVVAHREVGAFHPTRSFVVEVGEHKACFPLTPPQGDEAWRSRRQAQEDEARLWEKMEWFCPLWVPMGKLYDMQDAVRHCTAERAIELFDYYTSTLYTISFQEVCIAQILPQARSLREIVLLAREAYIVVYSGYRASSIAALIPAIEGSLTRIVADLSPSAAAPDKIDHAIDRAVGTAARLHFDDMWVPAEYTTANYLFGEDDRVFVFETFRRWLKKYFFCNTADYHGLTWLNRHMFAHGTASSWQQPTNFTRLVVALATLAAVESWYDASHHISFFLPEMNDDSTLLWQQALFQAQAQMQLKRLEQERYHQHGQLVPEMPTDKEVLLRKAVLVEDCMRDLVWPLREAGWSVEVGEPDKEALI